MPRPSKLTDSLQKDILDRLRAGATVQATCDSVGIHKSTFYDWLKRGEEAKSGKFSDFSDEATRAQADGMITAAIQFKKGMMPSESESVTTKTVSETRLKKDGTPYEYKKTETTRTITQHPGDWRAAMEYLARRDPDNWARQTIRHDIGNADGAAFEQRITVNVEYQDNNLKTGKTAPSTTNDSE